MQLMVLFVFQKPLQAQENALWKQNFEAYGFVKSDFWIDSRKVDGVRDDLIVFYPKEKVYDLSGKDINAGINTNFSAISTRLGLKINGQEILKAKVMGLLEGDFTGVTNGDINGLRLRHAYIRMSWKNDELLMGQYWHPMFVPEVFPEILSLNTGAPFQPFIRNPQISYRHFAGRFITQVALIMQRDNSSDGPIGRSHTYMQETGIPNSHLQLLYKTERNVLGAAFDHKVIRPLQLTAMNFKNEQLLSSLSVSLFWKWKNEKSDFAMKAIYGQNLTEHLLLGGYAVASRDELSGVETYTPTNHLFLWSGIHYGSEYQWSLFGGYAKNMGTTAQNIGQYYGKGHTIDYMFRVSPGLSWNYKSLNLAGELEWTAAAFGLPDDFGKVRSNGPTHNVRLLLGAIYLFNNKL